MNERIEKLSRSLETVRAGKFSISIAKGLLITESFKETEGEPQVIRNAKAIAKLLDQMPVFIEDLDLIVGNLASKPNTVELTCLWGTWSKDDIDSLAQDGFAICNEDRVKIDSMNEYWRHRTLTSRMVQLYDDERLWPYAQLGVVLPAFRSKEEGWGPGGMLGCGYGVRHEIAQILVAPDFATMLNGGTGAIIQQAEVELRHTRIFSADAIKKVDHLKAVIITHKAIIRFAARFAALATEMASREAHLDRKKELEEIARICQWVPANPARGFREAMQSLWFMFVVLLPSNVISLGRFDQYMYPFYRRDIDEGKITNAQVLEYLEWLRIKLSQIYITGGQTHRQKWAGMSKWFNCVIGGQTIHGEDATNELSYLILDAAKDCPTPHHTITMRVHEGTPEPLMLKALELVRTGIGMPAFIADQSCIDYLVSHGVSMQVARDYTVAGCLAVNLTGQSRVVAHPMFVTPLVFLFALHNGVDPRTGTQVGPQTGEFERFETFDEFMIAFKKQLAHFMELHAEFNNITIRSYGELFPQPLESSLMVDGIREGKDILERTLPFENGSVLNPIGMINVADSMAAIKKLVFDEHKVTQQEIMTALAANWLGERFEQIHQMCLAAPKYGNDDDYVDLIAKELYQFWADKTVTLGSSYGGKQKPASITIGTSQWPAGAETGATPDGRVAGECLADESMAAMRGRDTRGPLALIRSAAKINQVPYQSTSLDLRFHPAVLEDTEGLKSVSNLIMTYFRQGGKHIQFNVVSTETLLDAQKQPHEYADLIVRIGGCSAYFIQLSRPIQDEIIRRTEWRQVE